MKRLFLALALALVPVGASAQWQVPAGAIPIGRGDPIVGFTSIAPGSNGNCLVVAGAAWTSSTCTSIPGGSNGQVQYNNSGAFGGLTNAQLSALIDFSSVTTGTVAAARGGAGTITGALKGSGAGVVSQAACADLSNGTASCSTDTTNASNISSGTLNAARFVSRTFVNGGSATAVAASTTYFASTTVSTAEPGISVPVSGNVTLKNFYCQLGYALAAGTLTCTVRTGGNGSLSDSALTCTISSGQAQCVDFTHSVAVSASANYSVKMVSSVGMTTGTGLGWSLELDN